MPHSVQEKQSTRQTHSKWSSTAKIGLGIWMALMITAAFLYAPVNSSFAGMSYGADAPQINDRGQLYRIIFFHVPVAWVSVLAFLVATIYGICYLKNRKIEDDLKSSISAELGFFFCLLAMGSGMIFAKTTWGMFWNNDPREVSLFLLLLIYGAYFALRSSVEHEDRRAALSAVYVILAFISVPYLVFIAPRITDSLHPSDAVASGGRLAMNGKMVQVLVGSLIGYSGIYCWIYRLQLRVATLARHK
jgi:heme exporter protein C